MDPFLFKEYRKSHMFLNEVYFWTDTINDWKHLLKRDEFKQVIISQLQWLVNKGKIKIYAFVIMPNHIHLIWELLELNGKEMPNASFNKWTSNTFFKSLRNDNPSILSHFEESTKERKHRFWQRDPLAVLLDTKIKVEQKLEYLHLNPLQEHWNLCKYPEDYHWSSAGFYNSGNDEFGILTHYQERF